MTYPHFIDNGLTEAPVMVLVGSLGTTISMWDDQLREFSGWYRTIAVDLPGHGGTPVPDERCTVAGFAAEVIALMNALGVDRFAVVGLSFGGAVAQALAARYADRVLSVVIACAVTEYNSDHWHTRALTVRTRGLSEIVQRTAGRRFAPGFAEREPDAYARSLLTLSTMNPKGYAACCEALATHNARPLLPHITAPALILAGELDQVTPAALVQEMTKLIPDSTLRVINGAGHLVNVEKPRVFNAVVADHLANSLQRR
ncbi:alpha/beta fold hydrolase [Nocardia sp. NPDC052112]|uniref:alpha/beta fold hydrolase n=1 Tax=Nocardia sp. NPDC052112 TaxID=3155646 RepID=UPI003431B915